MEKGICCQIKDLEILAGRLLYSKSNGRLKPPTITQARVMNYILEHNGQDIYQKDLEKVLNLRRATVSEVLSTMEKRGLITRIKNSNDARTKKITLSELDCNKHQQIQDNIKYLEDMLTKDISEQELLAFSLTLKKMQDNLKKQYNKQGGLNV